MKSDEWTIVYKTEGKLAAEMVRLRLESFGIDVLMAQESLGGVYGLAFGPLGETNILVPESESAAAREILAAMDAGSLEGDSSNFDGDQENKDQQTKIT
jgi:hypothetical protein